MAKEPHRKAYTDNAVFLNRNLEVNDEFLAYFAKDDILTANMLEEIEAEPLIRRPFLRMISKRGPAGFDRFIEALVSTGQAHIAEKLDPALTRIWKNRKASSENAGNNRIASSENAGSPGGAGAIQTHILEDTDGTFISIDVQKADTAAAKQLFQSGDCYPLQSECRGHALIVDNVAWDTTLAGNIGCDFDRINLDQLFSRLHFDTKILDQELTAKDLITQAKEEASHEAHQEADAFLLVLISKGEQGTVLGSDGKSVTHEELLAMFDGKNCPSLIGKPKIFIVQTLRDEDPCKPSSKGSESCDTQDASVPGNSSYSSTHEKADFILVECAVPASKCYRKEGLGTRFFRSLVTTVVKYGHTHHLQDLVKEVKKQHLHWGITDAHIEVTSRTSKNIYFLPDYFTCRSEG